MIILAEDYPDHCRPFDSEFLIGLGKIWKIPRSDETGKIKIHLINTYSATNTWLCDDISEVLGLMKGNWYVKGGKCWYINVAGAKKQLNFKEMYRFVFNFLTRKSKFI